MVRNRKCLEYADQILGPALRTSLLCAAHEDEHPVRQRHPELCTSLGDVCIAEAADHDLRRPLRGEQSVCGASDNRTTLARRTAAYRLRRIRRCACPLAACAFSALATQCAALFTPSLAFRAPFVLPGSCTPLGYDARAGVRPGRRSPLRTSHPFCPFLVTLVPRPHLRVFRRSSSSGGAPSRSGFGTCGRLA